MKTHEHMVWRCSDNGFILAGSSGSLANKDVYILKTLSNGNLDWEKFYGSADVDEGRSVASTASGFLVSGYIKSTGIGNNDIYTIPVYGGIPTRITNHPSTERILDWYPGAFFKASDISSLFSIANFPGTCSLSTFSINNPLDC